MQLTLTAAWSTNREAEQQLLIVNRGGELDKWIVGLKVSPTCQTASAESTYWGGGAYAVAITLKAVF